MGFSHYGTLAVLVLLMGLIPWGQAPHSSHLVHESATTSRVTAAVLSTPAWQNAAPRSVVLTAQLPVEQ